MVPFRPLLPPFTHHMFNWYMCREREIGEISYQIRTSVKKKKHGSNWNDFHIKQFTDIFDQRIEVLPFLDRYHQLSRYWNFSLEM